MRRMLVAFAGLALVLAACGGKEEASVTATTTPGCTDPAASSGEKGKKPSITIPNCAPPKTLQSVDLIAGTGAEAKATDTITIHYVGVSWTNKREFDASWDNGAPATFPLSRLIPGWQQGIPGMKIGGRRMLTIPSDLGYGPQGQPPDIAPNDTLVFVIDLEKIG